MAVGQPDSVHEVTDRILPGSAGELPVRLYRSMSEPALVYFFGGGWILGSIETSDAICRILANAAGCVVVTPGYRLAPEWKFLAAVHDCQAVVRWVAAQAAGLDEAAIDEMIAEGERAAFTAGWHPPVAPAGG